MLDTIPFLQSFLIFKILILILIFLYVIFAFVVLNQVRLMNGVVRELHSSTIVQAGAVVHLLLAISLFVYALVIL